MCNNGDASSCRSYTQLCLCYCHRQFSIHWLYQRQRKYILFLCVYFKNSTLISNQFKLMLWGISSFFSAFYFLESSLNIIAYIDFPITSVFIGEQKVLNVQPSDMNKYKIKCSMVNFFKPIMCV